MGSRLAKCRVVEGTVKNGAAVRGVMQVSALLVPGGFFLSFFPVFIIVSSFFSFGAVVVFFSFRKDRFLGSSGY